MSSLIALDGYAPVVAPNAFIAPGARLIQLTLSCFLARRIQIFGSILRQRQCRSKRMRMLFCKR